MMKKILTASAVLVAVASTEVKFDVKDNALEKSDAGKFTIAEADLTGKKNVLSTLPFFVFDDAKKVVSKSANKIEEVTAAEVHINKNLDKQTLVFVSNGEQIKGDAKYEIAAVKKAPAKPATPEPQVTDPKATTTSEETKPEDATKTTTPVATPVDVYSVIYKVDPESSICKQIADKPEEASKDEKLKKFVDDCNTKKTESVEIALKRVEANAFTRYFNVEGTDAVSPIAYGDSSYVTYAVADNGLYYFDNKFTHNVLKADKSGFEAKVLPISSIVLAKSFEKTGFEQSFFEKYWKHIAAGVAVVVIAGVVFIVLNKNKKNEIADDKEIDLIEESA